ncbi:hypothetical protein SLA2020_172820 [Shorea laevis]
MALQPSPSPVPPSVDPSLPPPPPPPDLLVTAQKLIPPAPDPLRQNGHSPDLPVKSFKDTLVDGSSVMEPGTSSGHHRLRILSSLWVLEGCREELIVSSFSLCCFRKLPGWVYDFLDKERSS